MAIGAVLLDLIEEWPWPRAGNAARQHYCSKPECRRASKAAAQAAWLAKPQNNDYFSDPTHVKRVQAWRAHPAHRTGANCLAGPAVLYVAEFIQKMRGYLECPGTLLVA